MMLRWLCCYWIALAAVIAAAPLAYAGDEGAAPAQGAALGSALPGLKDGVFGRVINDENAAQYRNYLIPELYPLLRSGELEINTAQEPQHAWRLDDEWMRNSQQPYKGIAPGEESLGPEAARQRGYIFGLKGEISREPEPGAFGRKLLWNVVSAFWSQKIIDLDFSLAWFKSNRTTERFAGNMRRIYIPGVEPADKTVQMFRESVKFGAPAAIAGLGFLTFRFFGADEDVLWIYSPAIKKSRQLSGSNRTDAIMRSPVALDDFLTWSGKAELVTPMLERSLNALGLFAGLKMYKAVLTGGETDCFEVQRQFSPALRSAEEEALSAGPGGQASLYQQIFLPRGAVFVPRELWRVELTSQDPFALYGRQVLYVDSETMLPLFKVVFNRAGNLWKIVMTAFGLAATDDNSRKVPFPVFTAVLDRLNQESALISYTRVSFCSRLGEEIRLSDFDPRRMAD